MDDLQSIFSFLKKARGLYQVERFTAHPNGGQENDAEHSWSVAFICMVLADRLEEELDTKLDQEKMLKMALIHDLAEVQTGDTVPWNKKDRENKQGRERAAILDLTADLPQDLKDELRTLWEECEAHETLEAKIVKSIDRLDPVIHRTVFDIGWKGKMDSAHATVSALDERQLPRHSFSQTIEGLYNIVREEAQYKDLFTK